MKYRAHIRTLFAIIILVPASGFATTARCSTPPGTPGEVTCAGDDIALCEATGQACLSRCLQRAKGGLKEQQRALLSAILKRPSSDHELEKWSAALSAGTLHRGESVFTFDLGEGRSGNTGDKGDAMSSRLWALAGVTLMLGGVLLVINQILSLRMTVQLLTRRAIGRAAAEKKEIERSLSV
jgi:hypothetical protein